MRRGLADPVAESQAIFRALLEAMSRPGRVVAVPAPIETPPPLHAAAAAVCLTLVDFETPLWLDPPARTDDVVEYIHFHCGAPIAAEPDEAAFALVIGSAWAPVLDRFGQGTDEEPERSATLIVQVDGLDAGEGARLSGPGIAGEAGLRAAGLPTAFWTALRANRSAFPRGVDVILTAGCRLAALPRTTRVELA
jgi:alpha-D-ribose 1-methylphosphonate 5-triphosphate synthase subunit PhnH